jgi:flagellar protein FliJ
MKPRDVGLRFKRFEVAERERKVAAMETMVTDFKHMASDLMLQITAEEERTGVRDCGHFAYSTFAKSARLRRNNLLNSVENLEIKLDAARREHATVAAELRQLERERVAIRDSDSIFSKIARASMVG